MTTKTEKYTHYDVLQDNLAEALKIVSSFAAKKSTLPILSHALLKTDGGRLAVYATNLEVYAECFIGAMCDADFAIAVPIKAFGEVVGMLDGMVHLKADQRVDKLTISSQIVTDKKAKDKKAIKQENTMLCGAAEEFPIKPTCDVTVATFYSADLKRVISTCLFSVAEDDSRPTLTGLCFNVTENGTTVAAADGFRLSVNTMKTSSERPGQYIVPRALFAPLAKLVDDDEVVTMRIAQMCIKHEATIDRETGKVTIENQPPTVLTTTVEFATERIIIGGQIVDGKFPDYSQIIPADTPVYATVDRSQFLAALKAARAYHKGERSGYCTLTVHANRKNTMLVETTSVELGDAKIEVDVTDFVGHSLFMAFQIEYLQDAFNACTEHTIGLGFTPFYHKIDRPVKIVEGTFTHVIMPINRGDRQWQNSDTYVCTEQPPLSEMTEQEWRGVDGHFSLDNGPAGEYTNLFAAITAGRESITDDKRSFYVHNNDENDSLVHSEVLPPVAKPEVVAAN